MKKGAKIAIAIITPVVLASTIVGTVLGIKNSKENTTPANPDSSVTTPAQPDQPNIPNVPEQPIQPDQPNTPDQPIVEKTEQEYMQECKEKLKTTIENYVLNYMGRGSVKCNTYKLNELDGKIYTSIDYTYRNNTVTYFYTMNTNLNDLNKSTYEETSKSLESIKLSSIIQFSNIKNSVSEELYNQLCEYVLGKVGLDGAEVLNATEFTNINRMMGTILTVYKDNKVYSVEARTQSAPGSNENHINYMLASSTNEIKIISEEDFKEFFTV